MNNQKSTFERLRKSVLKSGAALLVVAGLNLGLLPEAKFAFDAKTENSAREKIYTDDDFDKKFREGRDLIDSEEWAKAAEKFKEIYAKYPDNKSADAALYWLAFCYKKQKQFREADNALNRLIERFPASSWTSDARVMKLEIAVPLGTTFRSTVPPATAANALSGFYSTVNPAAAPFNKIEGFGETYAASQTPLDREDEIKIAAFQSLYSADAKRGIEAMSGILRADSKASESLKVEVLRALRRPRVTYSNSSALGALTINSIDGQLIPALREALAKSFQNETNVKVRKEIIYTLANLKDEQSINLLTQLYFSEKDKELKKAIIGSFGSTWGGGLYFGGIPSIQNSKITGAAANQKQSLEFAKLLEIVRSEKDAELRNLALNNFKGFAGWETNPQTAAALIELYDSETNEDFKKSIIQNLGKIKQSSASKKLLEIAKNDKSDKLKIEAIYALRNSNTPEALKYLEELLK